MSARSASSVDELASDLTARLKALARAHDLTLPDLKNGAEVIPSATTVIALLQAIVAPHEDECSRISISGEDVAITGTTLTSFALLLHELTTNAAKYGALSHSDGRLDIMLSRTGEDLRLDWIEFASRPSGGSVEREGFGRTLERSVLRSLRGSLSRNWTDHGLSMTLTIPLSRFSE